MVKISGDKFEEKIYGYALKNAVEHDGKCQASSVLSPLFAEGLEKTQVREIMPKINEVVKKVNSLSLEEQKSEFAKISDKLSHRDVRDPNELPELPDAIKGKVVMRFRPAPSGPLHIGHIISNMLSSLFVKKYGGKFYIIIDDTDPKTTIKEAYKNHPKDCDWLFGNVHEYVNSSDNMKTYYEYAIKLIEKKAAYVCTCSQENFKKFAENKKECPCRKFEIKENLVRWGKMLDKKGFKQGEVVLRFKTPGVGMSHPNPAMRDFPLARISEEKHPKQGNKYRVWPLMNLVVSVDDMEYGMTHIIRGKDHRDNAERQKMIFEIFGKKFPWTFFMGRIKFTDLILSKRKIKAAIESGDYEGLEDPRLPTIASLRKRDYKPETFAKFATMRGLTEVDKVI
ncbi:glutamate--tRNA ligase, partial [Candidatus Pacearchaeota archaeon]|nr:glutamate--tRNA ligase [Candidatus Pacearchaeota archaeon]